MAKNILAILALGVAFAVIASEAKVVPSKVSRERPGFIFLGSTKKPISVTINGIAFVSYQEWSYWISVNAAGYAEAQRDCRANGDQLLQIETLDKLDDVEGFLQDTDQSVSLVWLGGKYQNSAKTFKWESGEDILDSLWGAGQPSQKKPNSRVAAETAGQIVQLKSQANTQAARYICEGL